LWLLALGSWLTWVCRIAPILTGHPIPSLAASEFSWLSVTVSSGHPSPPLAASESSWSVSQSLVVLVCVFVYTRFSACLSRAFSSDLASVLLLASVFLPLASGFLLLVITLTSS
jgi:hypothetical protein